MKKRCLLALLIYKYDKLKLSINLYILGSKIYNLERFILVFGFFYEGQALKKKKKRGHLSLEIKWITKDADPYIAIFS